MNLKNLIILMIVPLAMTAVSIYLSYASNEMAIKYINEQSTLPDIDNLKSRVEKEDKETSKENMLSFLTSLRALLINSKESMVGLANILYEHAIFQLYISVA